MIAVQQYQGATVRPRPCCHVVIFSRSLINLAKTHTYKFTSLSFFIDYIQLKSMFGVGSEVPIMF